MQTLAAICRVGFCVNLVAFVAGIAAGSVFVTAFAAFGVLSAITGLILVTRCANLRTVPARRITHHRG